MADHTTTSAAVQRVLAHLADAEHESLCNCRAYPDNCVSIARYTRDMLIAGLGRAEDALDEAVRQGWLPPTNTTVTDEAVEKAARAQAAAAKGSDRWTELTKAAKDRFRHMARTGLEAALPHLTDRNATTAEVDVDELIRKYVTTLTVIYNARTAGDHTFTGVLHGFATELVPTRASQDTETAALRAEVAELRTKLNQAYQHIGEQALIDMQEPIPPYGSPERDARVAALRGERN